MRPFLFALLIFLTVSCQGRADLEESDLPNVILYSGNEDATLRTCSPLLDHQITLGDIQDGKTTLFIEGGVYSPTWSPTGDLLAFIQVQPTELEVEIVSGQTVKIYKNSDSVKIIDSNGVALHQVGSSMNRKEIWTIGQNGKTCRTINGVFSLVGWSQDGNWIAFKQTENSRKVIHIANIQAETAHMISRTGQWEVVWANNSNQLIFAGYENRLMQVFQVTEEGIYETGEFQLPELEHNKQLSNPVWSSDDAAVFFLANGENYFSPMELWRFIFDSQEWSKELAFDRGNIGFFDNYIIVCKEAQGKRYMELYSSNKLEKAGSVEISSNLNCNKVQQIHNSILGDFSARNNLSDNKVWIGKIDGDYVTIKELDLAPFFKVDQNRVLLNIAWQP